MNAVASLLARLDDAAWESLASRGLLRRAVKDLEKGLSCEVIEDSPLLLRMRVGEHLLEVPQEGPARSRCACGGSGPCQHLISAGLFLRKLANEARAEAKPGEDKAHDKASSLYTTPTETATSKDADSREQPPGKPTQADAAPDTSSSGALLAMDESTLRRWCGPKAWKHALVLVNAGTSATLLRDATEERIVLSPQGITCRVIRGAGLDCILCDAPERAQHKAFIAAAILSLRNPHGTALQRCTPEANVLGEVPGAARSRAEVLETAEHFLDWTLKAGLTRADDAAIERLATLSVSADGCNLPRLSRILRVTSDELALLGQRRAQADSSKCLHAMAQTSALVDALRAGGTSPAQHLVGMHRRGYLEVPRLELHGCALFPWRSRSGFTGLTILLRDQTTGAWLTWTEARDTTRQTGWSPESSIDCAMPWEGGLTPRQITGAKIQLKGAKLSSASRLSSTTTCRVSLITSLEPLHAILAPLACYHWEELAVRTQPLRPRGLKPADMQADWVVLAPSRWCGRNFDAISQVFRWAIEDEHGASLTLELAYQPKGQRAIEQLEQWTPPVEGKVLVLARLMIEGGRLVIEPHTLCTPDGNPPVFLHMPPMPTSTTQALLAQASGNTPGTPSILDTPPQALEDDPSLQVEHEDQPRNPASPMGMAHATAKLLLVINRMLTELAERGVSGLDPRGITEGLALAKQADQAGLPLLGDSLREIFKLLARPQDSTKARGKALLRAMWITLLHMEESSLETHARPR